jgi:hypothetical protein
MCHLLISHYAIYQYGGGHDILHYAHYLIEEGMSKAISDLTKIMGVANMPILTLYSEADSLLGRGSVSANAKKEMSELSGINIPEGHNIQFAKGVIKKEVMNLLRESMPDVSAVPVESRWNVFTEGEDKYWKNRHVNCVNGSHHLPKGEEKYTYVGTKTRMQYLENQKENVLFSTKPVIEATLSWKYENPKVRPIKSEDTFSYLNEDYVMKAVERNWKSKEVLLDPSLGSKFKEGERLDKMLGSTYVMLDYSAMDKQHSLQSQYELTEALMEFLGAPQHVKKWMLEAARNQYLRNDDEMIKLVYSLLTGRRMTTFINTVLNKVYFKIAMMGLKPLSAMFAGDDIVTRWSAERDAKLCMDRALASRNVFNPHKQSWGPACEFLRVATKGKLTMCYANRILSSFVCGSWVNKMRLAETHLPAIFSRMAWMMDNRFMLSGLAACVMPRSLFNRTKLPIGICRNICGHTVSIDNGPVTPEKGTVLVLKPRTKNLVRDEENLRLPSFASRDYIGEFIDSHNQKCLNEGDIKSLIKTFTMASHLKGLTNGYEIVGTERECRNIVTFPVMCNERHLENVQVGVLSKHPTLPALRGQLPAGRLEQMVRLITGGENVEMKDREQWLFGDKARCVAMKLGNDFDDAAQLCKAKVFEVSVTTPTAELPRHCFT